MPKAKPLPNREWLLERLRYDPETGLFWWKRNTVGRPTHKPAGNKAYQARDRSPHAIRFVLGSPRKCYQAHRLAWLIMTGEDPGEMTIDHINRNPFDNRWENLRLADSSLQMRNRRNFGKSAHKGVHFKLSLSKWNAYAWIDGKRKHLGYFATEEEAAAVAAPYYIP